MATATEIIDLGIKLQLHKQRKIQKKAEELFQIYSDSMNAQGTPYCKNFESLLSPHIKNSWLKVAESVLLNETM